MSEKLKKLSVRLTTDKHEKLTIVLKKLDLKQQEALEALIDQLIEEYLD